MGISQIEQQLGVKLPSAYKDFLKRSRESFEPDDVSVLSSSEQVVQATLEHREGFAELPRWPDEYLYIGDEADACPYILDVATSKVFKSDKGDIGRIPIACYESFDDFIKHFNKADQESQSYKRTLLDWLMGRPILLVFLVAFIALPAIPIAIRLIYEVVPGS